MNTGRTSEDRLSWTTEGLNAMLPLYDDVQALQISAEERSESFIAGTLKDAATLQNAITSSLRLRSATTRTLWKADFWYTVPMPDLVPPTNPDRKKMYYRWFSELATTCPSEKLHNSWFSFVNVYLRNQQTWNNEPTAVLVDVIMSDNESDDEEADEDDLSEIEDEDLLIDILQ